MLKKILLLSVCLCFTALAFAQKEKPKTAEWYEKTAAMYYDNNKFVKALPYLLKYQSFKPEDNAAKLRIVKCYLETGRVEKALEYLDFLLQDKKPTPETLFLMARALHLSHKFDEAINYYKLYLATLDEKDNQRYFVKDDIKRCVVGSKIIYKEQLGLVENLGDKLNTSNDDFAPVFSPGYDNIIYFSSTREGNVGGMFDAEGKEDTLKGENRSDIYVSRLTKGEWLAASLLDERYNTVYHDVLNCFSKDGALVFLAQSKDMYFDYGDIFMANFFEDKGEGNTMLPEPINSSDFDGDVYMFNEDVMLISSDRAGGYGGKDLYISRKNKEGIWSKPANIGANINTPHNEVSPFLAADGRTLYFSSNNLESVGGLDIFVSKFDEKINNWTTPQNLGFPINSAADDDYFKLSPDGLRAFFSSSRPDGYGKRDLYVTYFRQNVKAQLINSDSIVFQYAIDNGLLSNKVVPIASTTNADTEAPSDGRPDYFKISPLYFGEYGESETLEMNSLTDLNQVVKLLNKHPKLNVELSSFVDNDGSAVHFNLFYSLKGAENIADYLIDQGVAPSRIFLKGCGTNYPVSKSRESDYSVIKGGRRLNRRVEVRIYRPETASVFVEYIEPTIIEDMALSTNTVYKKMIKGLSYKIQVKAQNTMLDDKVLSIFSDPMIERVAGQQTMHYTVGLYKSLTTAKEVQADLIERGFIDCKIIPYVDGERIEGEEIRAFSARFSELSGL